MARGHALDGPGLVKVLIAPVFEHQTTTALPANLNVKLILQNHLIFC